LTSSAPCRISRFPSTKERVVTDDTMELTHQDLVEALDRIARQLEVLDNAAIMKSLNLGMFDIEEMIKLVVLYKSKVVVDAHKQGVLEWK
jgi:hypothetical protein